MYFWLNIFHAGKVLDRLKAIFTTAAVTSKKMASFKSSQKQPENNHIASLVQIRDTLCKL
jgi:hypothetical protein